VSLTVHLLDRPRIQRDDGPAYLFRSQKSWGLLAFLVLSDRAPARSRVAELLFDRADDPLRALRWNLAEVRRGLGPTAGVEGDPIVLSLPEDAQVDVDVVARGSWHDAVALPGLGCGLLEGLTVRGAAGFESWLESEQQRLSAASEAILHEAALGSLSAGELDGALGYALRAAAMSPLDENHQALVIRLHRRLGDEVAARRQYDAVVARLGTELGVGPGRALESAMRGSLHARSEVASAASIAAIVEAGSAAVAAGATEAGVESLRTAVRLADSVASSALQISSRLVLAEALVHSLRGMDEEGLAALHAADRIAVANGDRAAMAEVRAELGYVDFLRARYDRAQLRLSDAIDYADGSPEIMAKATTYLGCVESDRGDYAAAVAHLDDGVALAAGHPRWEAYSRSMRGRVHLLRGELDEAVNALDAAIAVAERGRWLAFLPWPQALRGEVELARGDVPAAAALLEQAFARACQLGDPCWEGMAARGLAMVAESTGDVDRAFELLADARARCNRVADPYVWLDAYILDAQCEVGRRHGHPDTLCWVETMRTLASRTAMREMVVRSLLHGAAMGIDGDAAGALLLAEGIDNPELDRLLAAAP
jgi:DNA-binding SARP family transcriptional activator